MSYDFVWFTFLVSKNNSGLIFFCELNPFAECDLELDQSYIHCY